MDKKNKNKTTSSYSKRTRIMCMVLALLTILGTATFLIYLFF